MNRIRALMSRWPSHATTKVQSDDYQSNVVGLVQGPSRTESDHNLSSEKERDLRWIRLYYPI